MCNRSERLLLQLLVACELLQMVDLRMGAFLNVGPFDENNCYNAKRDYVVDPVECRAVSIEREPGYLPPIVVRVDMSGPECTYATYSGVVGTKTEESCLSPTQLACYQDSTEGFKLFVHDF
jgi:hypothetical protein